MKVWLLLRKLAGGLIIIIIFLILPLYSLPSKSSSTAVFLVLLNTLILPEPSIPVWLYIINLDKISTFLLVTFISRLPIILLFWPKVLTKIITKRKLLILHKWYNNVISWCKSTLLKLALFIKELVDGKKQKITASKNFLYYIKPLLALLFLFFAIVFDLIKFMAIKIKCWYQHRNKKIRQAIVDLGYAGVIIGAAAPFIPGTREAGIASVLIINNQAAKILYNIVDVTRILIETILF